MHKFSTESFETKWKTNLRIMLLFLLRNDAQDEKEVHACTLSRESIILMMQTSGVMEELATLNLSHYTHYFLEKKK